MRNIAQKSQWIPGLTSLLLALASGCGSASFGQKTNTTAGSDATKEASPPPPAITTAGDTAPATLKTGAASAGTSATPSGATTTPATAGTPDPKPAPTPTPPAKAPVTIPGATPAQLALLQQCLAAWPGNPFSGAVTLKTLVAESSYGGVGNLINDQKATAVPELVLVLAAQNYGSVGSYQLLNPNGYYCFNSNTDVGSVLTVNLNCAAHIAGPHIVQATGTVGSAAAAAMTGQNIGSVVKLNYVNPYNSTCLQH